MAMESTVRPCTSRTDVNVARVEELILGRRSIIREDAVCTILRKWKLLFVIDCDCQSLIFTAKGVLNSYQGGTDTSVGSGIMLTVE